MRNLLLAAAAAAGTAFTASVASATPFDRVVISQIYGGGGNVGAQFRNDFIELFNIGSSDVNLAGWSVQYDSATGGTKFGQLTELSGIIHGGGYLLIQEAQGAGGVLDLPSPDITGSILLSATSGRVALVNSDVSLGCDDFTIPCGPALVDLVGYGSASTFFEGSGPALGASNVWAMIRLSSGCVDTNYNTADFFSDTPTPRNSSSPTISCGASTDPAQAMPEPATLTLFCFGIAGLCFFSRRSASRKLASWAPGPSPARIESQFRQ